MKNTKRTIAQWMAKVNFLKTEINKLESIKNIPIIYISVFLLKCQLIEFELKQTLFILDLFLNNLQIVHIKKQIGRKVRTPKDFDQFTFRKLVIEMNQFEGTLVDDLKVRLNKLVDWRDHFTHHLFSQKKSIQELIEIAEKGINTANEVLKMFEILQKGL